MKQFRLNYKYLPDIVPMRIGYGSCRTDIRKIRKTVVKQLWKINHFCSVCNAGFAEGIHAHIDRLSLDQGADLCLPAENTVTVVELIRS